MKLRIQGNSLRLRLTQTEVARLHASGHVESCIEFAPGRVLTYALEGSPQARSVTASYDGSAILVRLPAPLMKDWAEGDQVSIAGASQASLQLLIEKDFKCLHKPDQQDPDAYPHPLASTATNS